jgi:hypothetical protein
MTDWPFSYAPGDLVGFATGDLLALVGLPTDDELVARIAAVVAGEAPTLDAVLDVLVSRGLRSVDTFGLAERTGDGLRVLVRGACRAVADDHATASPQGLWAESTWPGVSEAELTVDGADPRSLPLAGGIVLASRLGFGTRAGEVPAEPAPVPVPAEPDPEPDADEPGLDEPVLVEPAPTAEPEPEPAPEPATDPEPEVEPEPEPEPVAEDEPVLAVAPEYNTYGDEIPRPAPPAAPTPAAEPAGATLASPLTGPVPEGGPAEDEPIDEASDPDDAPAEAEPAASGGLITAMPWSLEDAFSAPSPPAPAPTPAAEETGLTVDGQALRAAQAGSETTVVAVLCPNDHANPVHATACRVCSQPLSAQQPVHVPRPSLGVLKLASGDVVALERGAILGRNPRLPQGWTGEQPHLVRIDDPERDVSGQHLEVRLDAWHVLVRDLGSTNGTEVVLPGSDPVLLRAHEQLSIEPGTRILLAGVFEVTYEAGA